MVRVTRITVIHLALVVFALLLVAQAVRIQIVETAEWTERARRQQFRTRSVAAPRGRILDITGSVLVESRELVKLSVAPREVKAADRLAAELRKHRFSPDAIRAALDTSRRWAPLPGLHVPSEVGALTSLAGVHAETVVRREYTSGGGMARIVGGLDSDGRPVGGIELSLDSLLAGDTAWAVVARDVAGRRLDSPESWFGQPRGGASVTLTINRDLQEICDRALARAADSLGASGGDIVVLNPSTGEILAMASRRRASRALVNTALSEPFEPGSTLKPFVAAALLEKGRAREDEVVTTHNGQMKIGDRTITDLHKAPELTFADVIRFSSNIGIVKLGARLAPRELYETLRDLGFGAPTGVPIPGEADGTLREPSRWNAPSAASLAMGYEIAVTPVQLAAAYGVLANGGLLMQPHVVREIREADGSLLYHGKPRVVRRVFSDPVTQDIRRLLVSVVAAGTATRADLATFQLAGKSGTARRTVGGRYVEGNYTASFVGLFPAEKPQYVVLVKIDSPREAFFGGEVAAPVSAAVLRAALAARDAALDRTDLASAERTVALVTDSAFVLDSAPAETVSAGVQTEPDPAPLSVERTPRPARVIELPFVPSRAVPDSRLRTVPDVSGSGVRSAVRALHQAGFRVSLSRGPGTATVPAAGTMLPAGSIVRLFH